jgi:hypothetical protein
MNQNASMASLPSSFDLEYEQVLILACLYLKIAFGELTKFWIRRYTIHLLINMQ